MELDEFRKYLASNLERFVKEHKKEIVLLLLREEEISESFFETYKEVRKYLRDNPGKFAYSAEIPDMSRLETTLYSLGKYRG